MGLLNLDFPSDNNFPTETGWNLIVSKKGALAAGPVIPNWHRREAEASVQY